jgi:hypothetical protein
MEQIVSLLTAVLDDIKKQKKPLKIGGRMQKAFDVTDGGEDVTDEGGDKVDAAVEESEKEAEVVDAGDRQKVRFSVYD